MMKIVTVLTIIGVLSPFCTIGESHIKRNHKNILSKIFALSSAGTRDNAIFDDYEGDLEFWNLEMPILLLQLVKMGDDILIPSVAYKEYGFGQVDDHVISKARLNNVTTTKVHASMNGNEFRVGLTIPDVEIICPECSMNRTLYSFQPPYNSDEYTFWRGFSVFIKNYVLNMTCNVTMGEHGLKVSDLDLWWDMVDLRVRRENGTHKNSDGSFSEWGEYEVLWQETLLKYWRIDGGEEYAEKAMQTLLNCFLSNGKYGGEKCEIILNEPLHHQSIAEIFHGLGLAALNNQRAGEWGSKNANAEEDPIRTASRLWFDYGTHILQTGKIMGAMQDGGFGGFTFPIHKTYTLNYTKTVCSDSNGDDTNCEDVLEYIRLGGEDENGWEATTQFLGAMENNAEIVFGLSNFSYSFTVPNFTLTSQDFEKISTNLNTGVQNEYRGLDLTVANSMIGVTCDFEFAEGHFQVSNLRLKMDLGEISMSVPNVVKSENGSVSELPPIHEDAVPMVMALWESKDESGVALEERYGTFLQAIINEFLSGRSSV